jgi:hypothetical protein
MYVIRFVSVKLVSYNGYPQASIIPLILDLIFEGGGSNGPFLVQSFPSFHDIEPHT